MEIKSTMQTRKSGIVLFTYRDSESYEELGNRRLTKSGVKHNRGDYCEVEEDICIKFLIAWSLQRYFFESLKRLLYLTLNV